PKRSSPPSAGPDSWLINTGMPAAGHTSSKVSQRSTGMGLNQQQPWNLDLARPTQAMTASAGTMDPGQQRPIDVGQHRRKTNLPISRSRPMAHRRQQLPIKEIPSASHIPAPNPEEFSNVPGHPRPSSPAGGKLNMISKRPNLTWRTQSVGSKRVSGVHDASEPQSPRKSPTAADHNRPIS
ncbi:hypothetical protein ACLOJK_006838, partial [Asimina triloba]